METWIDADSGCKKRFEIVSVALRHNQKLIDFLFLKHKAEMFSGADEVLRKSGMFSSGEQVLVKVAVDIWFNESRSSIFDICRRLDPNNFVAVMEAMVAFRAL